MGIFDMILRHLSGMKTFPCGRIREWMGHCGFHFVSTTVRDFFRPSKYKPMSSQFSGAFTDLGKSEDLYYVDPDNCKVESIPVEYNTRFSQDFSNKSSGSSTFIIPPGNGMKHVVICLGYNASSINTQVGENVLPLGWGYNAIQQISFRIGK
jgi:hypothetical protein